jgi:hypothetical protein
LFQPLIRLFQKSNTVFQIILIIILEDCSFKTSSDLARVGDARQKQKVFAVLRHASEIYLPKAAAQKKSKMFFRSFETSSDLARVGDAR